MPMATQPPNRTLTAARTIFAPPRNAPIAPEAASATLTNTTMEMIRCSAVSQNAPANTGIAAPTTNAEAEARAAC